MPLMLKKFIFLLISIGYVVATSSCNPLSTSCSADKALATSINERFTASVSQFTEVSTPSGISYSDDNGLELTIAKQGDYPAIRSNFYIMFGRVEVHLKAANGTGIVSSFFLQSDDFDEIDIELFGGDKTQFQSNYFSKGNTTLYDRGEYHSISGAPQESYHNYTLDWTSEKLEWWLDGSLVRTLKNTSSEGYPQTPMRISTGIWAGGDSENEQGTIEWAGGLTTYNESFSMLINYLSVDDYSTGSAYKYTDKSGSWTSIEAVDGEINGRLNSTSSANSISSILISSSTMETTSNSYIDYLTSFGSASSIISSKSSKNTGTSAAVSPAEATGAISVQTTGKNLSSNGTKSSATSSLTTSASSENIAANFTPSWLFTLFAIILLF